VLGEDIGMFTNRCVGGSTIGQGKVGASVAEAALVAVVAMLMSGPITARNRSTWSAGMPSKSPITRKGSGSA
jgi:hypothetical protein